MTNKEIDKVVEEKFEEWIKRSRILRKVWTPNDDFKAGFMACVEWLLPELQSMENACDSHSANDKSYVNHLLYELCRKLSWEE